MLLHHLNVLIDRNTKKSNRPIILPRFEEVKQYLTFLFHLSEGGGGGGIPDQNKKKNQHCIINLLLKMQNIMKGKINAGIAC
jgi:hypothetical protein